jgi:ligand-binding sensor domain-containing protein/two-component sensor histidine kinase
MERGGAQGNRYYLQHLSTEQGLIGQQYNFFLHKDLHHQVWIPSLSGVTVFNGQSVTPFLPQPEISDQLAKGLIFSRFFDTREGEVLFNTSNTLHTYQPLSGKFRRDTIKLTNERWQLLHYDDQDSLYWILDEPYLKLVSLEDSTKNTQIAEGIAPFGYGIQLVEGSQTPKKYLLLPVTRGWEVHTFADNKRTELSTHPDTAAPGYAANSFYLEEDDRTLWVGTDTGLTVMDLQAPAKELTFFDDYNGVPIRGICSIAPTADGMLIVATRAHGIFFFDPALRKFIAPLLIYDRGDIIPFPHTIDQIEVDGDQVLWIATQGKGVYYTSLKKRKFNSYLQNRPDLAQTGTHIQAISEDTKGNIWCLRRDGIVVLDKSGAVTSPFPGFNELDQPFRSVMANYLFHDADGGAWVCGGKGLYHLSARTNYTWKQVSPKDPSGKNLNFIYGYQLKNGRLIFSTYQNGLYELPQGEDLYLVKLQEEFSARNTTTAIYENKDNKVLLANEWNRVVILDPREGRFQQLAGLDFENLVYDFLDDTTSDSLTWVGTNAGLYKLLRTNAGYRIEKDPVFPNYSINGMLQDANGRLWISTNQSLYWYQPGGDLHRYSLADGLPTEEFNFHASCKTADGHFAFGSVNGLTIFRPDLIHPISTMARPMLTRILINDEPAPDDLACMLTGATNISFIKKIALPFSQNTLSFWFTAREYSDPSANCFKFRMEGVDDEWVLNGKLNYVRYPNLPPGTYTFQVQASNSDEEWSDAIAEIFITIRPAWYQTIWFYALVVLFSLLLAYFYYRYRIRRIKEKEAVLRREAEYRQEVAETKNAILRLQMKPHFIFNSLNSISSYIQNKDINTANDYLVRFSKLIRKILDLADEPLIELGDEIELLEQYLLTESMRLERKFTFSIDCDDALDLDDTLIPTMILQPFIENAIWHGVAGKDGTGHIQIEFRQEGNQMRCSVEDDGLGRQANGKPGKTHGKEHESKALGITEKRLQFLADKTGKPTDLKIIDLKDKNGDPAGTRVEVVFPIIE